MAGPVFTNQKFAQFNKIAEEKFYQDLKVFLTQSFPDVSPETCCERLNTCRENCENLGIDSEYSIYAFCVLSFMFEKALDKTTAFTELQEIYQTNYGSLKQLPIDMYEVGEQCGAL